MPRSWKRSRITAGTGPIMKIRTFSELARLKSFEERYRYLRLDGRVGEDTFGFDRYINQRFYHSKEWKSVRDYVISRDSGCDLGVPGHEIHGRIYIHHMNPISVKDIERASEILLDPEYLVCVTHSTHNAIHYGDEAQLPSNPVDRFPNDTCPWKAGKEDAGGKHFGFSKKAVGNRREI